MPRRQRSKLEPPAEEERVGSDNERIGTVADERREGSLDVAADGTLTGTCTETFDQKVIQGGGGLKKTKTGSLSGRLDMATQRVELRFESTGVYDNYKNPTCDTCPEIVNTATHHVVIDQLVSGGDVVELEP